MAKTNVPEREGKAAQHLLSALPGLKEENLFIHLFKQVFIQLRTTLSSWDREENQVAVISGLISVEMDRPVITPVPFHSATHSSHQWAIRPPRVKEARNIKEKKGNETT